VLRWIALSGLLLAGCDDGDPPLPPPGDTPCGSDTATLVVGDESPFVANPDQRYLLEAGRQGGFHTHLSLRAQGALDPDLVDIEITLADEGRVVARHVTTEWLLSIDRTGPFCDYNRARLILVDEEGGLFSRDAAIELAGRPLTLTAQLTSPEGDAETIETITLDASDL
jgi:hypothetical protein